MSYPTSTLHPLHSNEPSLGAQRQDAETAERNDADCEDFLWNQLYKPLTFKPIGDKTFFGSQRQDDKTAERNDADFEDFRRNHLFKPLTIKPIGDKKFNELWPTYPKKVERLFLLFEPSASDNTWSRKVIDTMGEWYDFPPFFRVNTNRKDLFDQFNIKNPPVIAVVSREGLINQMHIDPDHFKKFDLYLMMFCNMSFVHDYIPTNLEKAYSLKPEILLHNESVVTPKSFVSPEFAVSNKFAVSNNKVNSTSGAVSVHQTSQNTVMVNGCDPISYLAQSVLMFFPILCHLFC